LKEQKELKSYITHFKAILQMNLISNNPITIEDIKLAEQVVGLDIRLLKGKTTHKTPEL
jgi:hypothetical protein